MSGGDRVPGDAAKGHVTGTTEPGGVLSHAEALAIALQGRNV